MKLHRRYLFIGGALVFLLGFFAAYYGLNFKLSFNKSLLPQKPEAKTESITVQVTDLYLGCQHTEEYSKVIKSEELSTLLKEVEDWEIKRVDKKNLILTRKNNGLCPICRQEEFLGIHGENIVIYFGRPDRPGPVKEVTPIKILSLPEKEIADLKRGVVFKDQKEKLLILEGYSGLSEY